jgi:hypothetical protein
MIEINPKMFYKIGCWCFAIIAIANLVAFPFRYSYMDIFGVVSTIAGIIFNFVLFGFFLHIYRQTPDLSGKLASDSEMEEMLKLNSKEVKHASKRR